MASSAQHINEMGPPYRLDVWAWAQGSVRWVGGGWEVANVANLGLIEKTFALGDTEVEH